eukprot:3987359-Pyramimonas_sp.AAC.1
MMSGRPVTTSCTGHAVILVMHCLTMVVLVPLLLATVGRYAPTLRHPRGARCRPMSDARYLY